MSNHSDGAVIWVRATDGRVHIRAKEAGETWVTLDYKTRLIEAIRDFPDAQIVVGRRVYTPRARR